MLGRMLAVAGAVSRLTVTPARYNAPHLFKGALTGPLSNGTTCTYFAT